MNFKYILSISIIFTLTTFHTMAFSKNNASIEFGVGIEYGFVGTQFHFPIGGKTFDVYGAIGITQEGKNQLGGGIGTNFYLDNHSTIGLFFGVLNIEKTYTDTYSNSQLNNPQSYLNDSNNYEINVDVGLSAGYKYYFSKIGKSGWVLGATYNVYNDGHYPFFSIGYRY